MQLEGLGIILILVILLLALLVLEIILVGGANNKVLLAQITTNGSFCGVFNLQVFNGGDQAQNQYLSALGFCSTPGEVFGCTNPAATNYDPLATQDDFSCTLPCSVALVVESIISPSCFGGDDGYLNITSTGVQGSDDYYLGETDTAPTNSESQ